MSEEMAAKSAPKLLLFTYGALGVLMQVEIPEFASVPKGQEKPKKPLERSRDGSLHFRPASTILLTEDEHEYVKQNAPEVAKHLLFVAVHESHEAKLERLKAESAKAHNKPSPSPTIVTTSASGGALEIGASSEVFEEAPKKKSGKQSGSGD
jgi:hypothetical protein